MIQEERETFIKLAVFDVIEFACLRQTWFYQSTHSIRENTRQVAQHVQTNCRNRRYWNSSAYYLL